MKEVSFEPMSIGRILDYTFKIYRDNFLRFIAIVAVVIVPVQLLIILSQGMMYADIFSNGSVAQHSFEGETDGTEGGFAGEPDVYGQEEYIYDDTSDHSPLIMMLGGFVTILGTFLAIIGNKLSQGALTYNVSQYYMGRNITFSQAYRHVGKRIFRLLGAAVLVGLIVFAGFLLFVVPGVIFGLWYAIVVPVIITEDCGIREALSRSKSLVKGNMGKVFLLGLLAGVIGLIVQVPFQIVGHLLTVLFMPVNMALAMVSARMVEIIGQVIVAPIAAAAYILLYYDLRIRKEGYDLEMMAEATLARGPVPDEVPCE